MMRAAVSAGIFVLASGAAFGQTSDVPAFEIADVHVSAPTINPNAGGLAGGLMRGGRYELRRATMLDLVRTAYNVDAEKVLDGPSWLEMDRFDVIAKAPADVKPDTAKLMLRGLLADRFKLVVHNDTKPVPAYALTAGKKTQLKESDGTGDPGCKFQLDGNGGGRGGSGDAASAPALPTITYTCHNMTMEAFTQGMGGMPASQQFIGSSLVADQTGLKGAWDFSFQYTVRGRVSTAGVQIVTLFDALDKQLGLKLEPAMIPTAVIVVDSVNQKPTGNSAEAAKVFPPLPTEFEVADVKPSAPDEPGPSLQIQPGGRINIQALPLKFLVEQLWNLTDEMVVGAPKFMETDKWDIVAKAPAAASLVGVSGPNDLPVDFDSLLLMLKNLMAERFKLSVHFEERTLPAYTLTAAKPKMKKADPTSRTRCKEGPPALSKSDARDANPVLGRLLTCQNTTMAQLAEQLPIVANGYVHSAVLDASGLEGGWDFTVNFSTIGQLRGGDGNGPAVPGTAGSGAASDPNGAVSLPDAMEKQLGVKLELQKRPVKVLVIDHIEQKPTDN